MIDICGLLMNTNDRGWEDNSSYLAATGCGYQKFWSKDLTTLRKNGRVDYQIIYVIKGKGLYKLNGEFTEISKGNIIFYYPGEEQHYMYFCNDSPEIYWVHFTGYGVKEYLNTIGLAQKIIHHVGIDEVCIELFKKIMNELQVKQTLFQQISSAYLIELLSQLARLAEQRKNGINSYKYSNLHKVIEVMHAEYNETLSVNDLAKISNLSLYRFIHNFKSFTGLSPLEYLTKIRIDKAKVLLKSNQMTINEVANLIGYENQSYFSKQFKKSTGMSPSSYSKT